MSFSKGVLSFSALFLALPLWARTAELPAAPTDPSHPGSKIYSFAVSEKSGDCSGRKYTLFLPTAPNKKLAPATSAAWPVVVFGHGQALDVQHYRGTFEHLAGKGVAALYPVYDTGFFDQNWTRMAKDYVELTQCALRQHPSLDPKRIVFSGHSKGAYVASIAATQVTTRSSLELKQVILFAPAGTDETSLSRWSPELPLTVVYSDQDRIVSRDISETIYSKAASRKKQFIFFKSFTNQASRPLAADHFWVLTRRSSFGGGPESSFHYHGSWKWLVAAALDLEEDLFGERALDKGLPGFRDERL